MDQPKKKKRQELSPCKKYKGMSEAGGGREERLEEQLGNKSNTKRRHQKGKPIAFH